MLQFSHLLLSALIDFLFEESDFLILLLNHKQDSLAPEFILLPFLLHHGVDHILNVLPIIGLIQKLFEGIIKNLILLREVIDALLEYLIFFDEEGF